MHVDLDNAASVAPLPDQPGAKAQHFRAEPPSPLPELAHFATTAGYKKLGMSASSGTNPYPGQSPFTRVVVRTEPMVGARSQSCNFTLIWRNKQQ
eukprot:1887149-Amphidinium_carterae.3